MQWIAASLGTCSPLESLGQSHKGHTTGEEQVTEKAQVRQDTVAQKQLV